MKQLDIDVRGDIAEHCAMGNVQNMDFGDITRPGLSAEARVSLSCNVPFTMKVRALNGALANETMPAGQGPYAGAVPYTIALAVPLRKPERALASAIFQSRDLQGGQTLSSQGGIAVDGLTLSVALGRVANEAGLLAGNYGETIEITITPD